MNGHGRKEKGGGADYRLYSRDDLDQLYRILLDRSGRGESPRAVTRGDLNNQRNQTWDHESWGVWEPKPSA